MNRRFRPKNRVGLCIPGLRPGLTQNQPSAQTGITRSLSLKGQGFQDELVCHTTTLGKTAVFSSEDGTHASAQVVRTLYPAKPCGRHGTPFLERLLNPVHLDALFARTAQRQYTQHLLFSTTVDLMAQVVLGRKPSVHAAYQALIDHIPVSDTAVYDKLQRTELAVSSALVHDSATRAGASSARWAAQLPPGCPVSRCKIVDGSHLEATQHRLAELRATWAAPLPGKGLVVFDPATSRRHRHPVGRGWSDQRTCLDAQSVAVGTKEGLVAGRQQLSRSA